MTSAAAKCRPSDTRVQRLSDRFRDPTVRPLFGERRLATHLRRTCGGLRMTQMGASALELAVQRSPSDRFGSGRVLPGIERLIATRHTGFFRSRVFYPP